RASGARALGLAFLLRHLVGAPVVAPEGLFLRHHHRNAVEDHSDPAWRVFTRRHVQPSTSGAPSWYWTNDSGSLTRKPYSASARMATRLCSHRELGWLPMATVAWVEPSEVMPPTTPHAAWFQLPPKATVRGSVSSGWATPSDMYDGRLMSRPGRAAAAVVSASGVSTYSGRPVVSSALRNSGSVTSSSAKPVRRLPSSTRALRPATTAVWTLPVAVESTSSRTSLEVWAM